MKHHSFRYLLFALCIGLVASYSLPGDWKLKNIDGQATDKEIVLSISETVTQSGEIKHNLSFSNCHSIDYQVNVKQNFMSIDSNSTIKTTLKTEEIVSQCAQEEAKLEQRISQTLKKVFFFAIRSDILVFVSPNGNDLFEFSRIKKIYLTNLTGTWLLDEIYWQRASNTEVAVTKDNFTFCDGKLVATYKTNHISEIQFDIIKNDDCHEANLTKALKSVRYYRLKDFELELYNYNSIEVIQLMYVNGGSFNEQEKVLSDQESQKTNQGSVVIVQSENPGKVDQTVEFNLRSIQEDDPKTA